MDEAEAEAQGNEWAMHEDDEPPTASPSSSHVNEDNFQLVFGLLDSLASSMGNLTTSMKNLGTLATNMDNFSTMVTQRLSTYDENFARLAQIMDDINERLKQDGIWLLVSHLCFDDAKGGERYVIFCHFVSWCYLTFWSLYFDCYIVVCILMLLVLWHFGHGCYWYYGCYILMLFVLCFKPNSREEIFYLLMLFANQETNIWHHGHYSCYWFWLVIVLWLNQIKRMKYWILIGIYKVLLILWWKCLNQNGIFEPIGEFSYLVIIGKNAHIYIVYLIILKWQIDLCIKTGGDSLISNMHYLRVSFSRKASKS